MPTYGVTDTGFVPKPVDVAVTEMADALRSKISQALNTQAESPLPGSADGARPRG